MHIYIYKHVYIYVHIHGQVMSHIWMSLVMNMDTGVMSHIWISPSVLHPSKNTVIFGFNSYQLPFENELLKETRFARKGNVKVRAESGVVDLALFRITFYCEYMSIYTYVCLHTWRHVCTYMETCVHACMSTSHSSKSCLFLSPSICLFKVVSPTRPANYWMTSLTLDPTRHRNWF